MKMRWYDRLLISFTGLIMMFAGMLWSLSAARIISIPATESCFDRMGIFVNVLWVVVGIIVLLWGMRLLVAPWIRYTAVSKMFFILNKGQSDEVHISSDAVNHIIHRALDPMDTVHEFQSRIDKYRGHDSSVRIKLNVILHAGANIPQTVAAIQAAVRDSIETLTGLAVANVQVVVTRTHDNPAPVEPKVKVKVKAVPVLKEPEIVIPAPVVETPVIIVPPAPIVEVPAPDHPFGEKVALPVDLSKDAFRFPE